MYSRQAAAEFDREEACAIEAMDLIERLKAEGRWPARDDTMTPKDER